MSVDDCRATWLLFEALMVTSSSSSSKCVCVGVGGGIGGGIGGYLGLGGNPGGCLAGGTGGGGRIPVGVCGGGMWIWSVGRMASVKISVSCCSAARSSSGIGARGDAGDG